MLGNLICGGSLHFLVVECKVWAGGSYGKKFCVRYFFSPVCCPSAFGQECKGCIINLEYAWLLPAGHKSESELFYARTMYTVVPCLIPRTTTVVNLLSILFGGTSLPTSSVFLQAGEIAQDFETAL